MAAGWWARTAQTSRRMPRSQHLAPAQHHNHPAGQQQAVLEEDQELHGRDGLEAGGLRARGGSRPSSNPALPCVCRTKHPAFAPQHSTARHASAGARAAAAMTRGGCSGTNTKTTHLQPVPQRKGGDEVVHQAVLAHQALQQGAHHGQQGHRRIVQVPLLLQG